MEAEQEPAPTARWSAYASGYDNRTSLILFRHPGVNARTMELGIGADADVGFAWSGRRRWCRRRSRAGSYGVIGNDRQIALTKRADSVSHIGCPYARARGR